LYKTNFCSIPFTQTFVRPFFEGYCIIYDNTVCFDLCNKRPTSSGNDLADDNIDNLPTEVKQAMQLTHGRIIVFIITNSKLGDKETLNQRLNGMQINKLKITNNDFKEEKRHYKDIRKRLK